MRLLFKIDKKGYKEDGTVGFRPSVRGIIIRGDKIAMIHSLKYHYYKLPDGGAEQGEDQIDTLIREVREESGLNVIRSSVRQLVMFDGSKRARLMIFSYRIIFTTFVKRKKKSAFRN